jgi:hypothetical protein
MTQDLGNLESVIQQMITEMSLGLNSQSISLSVL